VRSKFSKLKFFSTQSASALCVVLTSPTFAQQTPNEITITAELPVRVSGFDGISQQEIPFSVSTFDNATLRSVGAQRVTDALRLDASVSDNYNLPAYWDKLSVRGYALDNRYNYRREGLPISAESIIPMDNKERIELLKGTSGIQSGTSAPGGLVNYVVKRAPSNGDKTIRDVTLSYGPGNNRLTAADLGGRFGEDASFGYRFNVAYENLDPYIRDTQGHRNLVALAMDWRIDSSNRLEWEFEQSHHEQIGVNFYSLLGSGAQALPPTVDGTRNITRQPNSLPGVFDGQTGTLRWRHLLNNGWIWSTQAGLQHLRADDRLVYASGCPTAPTDRFCSNGDFEIRDYRSDNERRNNDVVQTDLRGQQWLAGFEHSFKVSMMRQRQINRMPDTHTDELLGTTNSFNGGLTPATTPNSRGGPMTNNSDYSTEIALNDRVRLNPQTSVWLGLRYTQLNRQSVQTNGSAAVQDTRNVNTPWVALSHQLNASDTVYASYGYGLEAQAAPNLSSYTNAGQALPALRSTQREMGLKRQYQHSIWQATWFDITRPQTTSGLGCTNTPNSCTLQMDGQNRHQGLELSALTQSNPWNFGGSAMWLDAKREHATIQTDLNGQRPINVPQYILRGMTEYRYPHLVGLRAGLRISHEGQRNVTEYGDIRLPAWTTVDIFTHYDTKINNWASNWTLAINNVANKQYWRESPRQYGQYFLYPGAPRTLRATVVLHL
jgi:iron complex outermembrane receptor protein